MKLPPEILVSAPVIDEASLPISVWRILTHNFHGVKVNFSQKSSTQCIYFGAWLPGRNASV